MKKLFNPRKISVRVLRLSSLEAKIEKRRPELLWEKPDTNAENTSHHLSKKQSIKALILTVLTVIFLLGFSSLLRPEPPTPVVSKRTQPVLRDQRKKEIKDLIGQLGSVVEVGKECRNRLVLQVVAHPDDDLLFMNPDTQRTIGGGDCVTTIYLTSGDLGQGKNYADGREHGIEAAYGAMLGSVSPNWREDSLQLGSLVVRRIISENSQVQLIFLRLQDGNVNGLGFGNSESSSLKLVMSDGGVISQYLGGETYNKAQLENVLAAFMSALRPREVRGQMTAVKDQSGDHSDHGASGVLTAQSAQIYSRYFLSSPVKASYYSGYPIRYLPANLTSDEQVAKQTIFAAYAMYDSEICPNQVCSNGFGEYGDYFSRRYVDASNED